jgi:hypothetical protein
MGTLFVTGQKLTAASLNQYYGFSEGADTAVNAASQSNLSTPNTIPTNEASVGSAYTIEFGGSGRWTSASSAGSCGTTRPSWRRGTGARALPPGPWRPPIP